MNNWPELAGRLALCLPAERLNVEAVGEIETRLADGGRIAVACSGGADSLALLLLLWTRFHDRRAAFFVAHFDHRIRGAESADDARFVAEVSQALGMECVAGEWADSHIDASEDEARVARMEFLHARSKTICFGHNRTDVAETMLLRLGRGSSLDGLAGPRPVQRFGRDPALVHIRPLLDLSGAEIREVLRECSVPWREDSTNAKNDYARNRLRHDVVPLLDTALGRDWSAGAARSRSRIDEADRLIESLATEYAVGAGEDLDLAKLRTAGTAVVRRAVEAWLSVNGLRERVGPEALDDLVADVADGVADETAYRDLGFEIAGCKLRLRAKSVPENGDDWAGLRVAAGCEICFPWGARLKVEALELGEGVAESLVAEMKKMGNNTVACLSVPCRSTLEIRRRMRGDAYGPLGLGGKTRLKKAFIDRKIPLRERERLPIVLVENRIAWCPMLPPADEFKLTAASKEAIRLTYFPKKV